MTILKELCSPIWTLDPTPFISALEQHSGLVDLVVKRWIICGLSAPYREIKDHLPDLPADRVSCLSTHRLTSKALHLCGALLSLTHRDGIDRNGHLCTVLTSTSGLIEAACCRLFDPNSRVRIRALFVLKNNIVDRDNDVWITETESRNNVERLSRRCGCHLFRGIDSILSNLWRRYLSSKEVFEKPLMKELSLTSRLTLSTISLGTDGIVRNLFVQHSDILWWSIEFARSLYCSLRDEEEFVNNQICKSTLDDITYYLDQCGERLGEMTSSDDGETVMAIEDAFQRFLTNHPADWKYLVNLFDRYDSSTPELIMILYQRSTVGSDIEQ